MHLKQLLNKIRPRLKLLHHFLETKHRLHFLEIKTNQVKTHFSVINKAQVVFCLVTKIIHPVLLAINKTQEIFLEITLPLFQQQDYSPTFKKTQVKHHQHHYLIFLLKIQVPYLEYNNLDNLISYLMLLKVDYSIINLKMEKKMKMMMTMKINSRTMKLQSMQKAVKLFIKQVSKLKKVHIQKYLR